MKKKKITSFVVFMAKTHILGSLGILDPPPYLGVILRNILVLAASFGASIQIVKHTAHCNAWQSVDSFTFTGSNDRRILTNYIIREEGENSLFKCTICGHVNALKTNVLNHVESIHFPNTFQYSCDICGKTTKSKQSLYKHVSVNHRQGKLASN